MNLLENGRVWKATPRLAAAPLPVHALNRPNLDFRGFCGQIAAGHIRPATACPARRRDQQR